LLCEVYGADLTCFTRVASHRTSNAPRNSVPLSVLTRVGFPKTWKTFSWTALATVALPLSGIKVNMQNLLKQHMAESRCTFFPSVPRFTTKSRDHSHLGPGGKGNNYPCHDP
jgi:hypothetical protein